MEPGLRCQSLGQALLQLTADIMQTFPIDPFRSFLAYFRALEFHPGEGGRDLKQSANYISVSECRSPCETSLILFLMYVNAWRSCEFVTCVRMNKQTISFIKNNINSFIVICSFLLYYFLFARLSSIAFSLSLCAGLNN